jgi:hypothetical protein
MLDSDQLLHLLEQKKVRNIDIARALGLPDSRIPGIRRKDRKLTLDEGAKLVRAFALEQDQGAPPIPPAILRLIVLHIARELGSDPDDNRLEELAQDLRAFSEFVADPKVRRSLNAAEAFFQAMRLRRPKSGSAAPQRSDPRPAR